jgi:RNA polymerase sigma factor (sigma-70 family)
MDSTVRLGGLPSPAGRPVTPALARQAPLIRAERLEQPLELGEVYRAHAEQVAKWACRLGGLKVDYEDVVQEVFIKVQRELPSFRHEARLTTWLYRMTLNEVRYRRRKNWVRRWLGGLVPTEAAELASTAPAAPDQLARRESVKQLYRALDGMSEKHRQVLVLFELEERSGEEVARLMGARGETVWVWLHRARAELSKRFEASEEGR